MAAADTIMWIALCTAFASGALVLPSAVAGIRRMRASEKARSKAIGDDMHTAALLRRGVGWFAPLAGALLKVGFVAKAFDEAEAMASMRGYATTAKNLCSIWCAASVGAIAVGSMVASSPVFGIAAAVCASAAGWFLVERARESRTRRMREGVPDVFRAMESCFFAGLSLLQTFQHLADESPEPLDAVFDQAARKLEMGETPSRVLGSFRKQAALPELSFVAIALEIQHDAGGSMRQVLAAARDSIENDLELRRSLQVQTAQAKLSARVVTVLPFVLIAVFSLITEDFLAPFFSGAAGVALLTIAVVMQAAGVLSVRSMLKVGFD